MPITGIIQSLGGFGSDEDLYGKKPIVPEYPDYGRAVGQAVSSNIRNLPRIENLAEQSTQLYRDLLNVSAPGATGLIDKGTANIKDMLEGKLPSDLSKMIGRAGAEASRAAGYAGSLFGAAGTAMDIGKTSYDIATQGLAAAERWLASAANRTFDFSKMFLGPQDAIRQAEGQFGRDWLAAQVEAAPDPASRGAFDSEMAMLGMVLSAYGGGAGYTQGYRPNYGAGGGGGGGAYPMGGGGGGGGSFFGSPSYNYGEGGAIYETRPGLYGGESSPLIV